ncbi:MAG: helix-turn-helix transcriptional regulator [Saprospiraceae bacterium]|nr:helix-turn-helix transcriptional regulator [Saprospiraceae bacterium]
MKNQIKQLGFNLREARETKKITREDLADRLNVHFRTLAKWENGQSDPPVGKIMKIAEVLEMPMAKLLGLDPNSVKVVSTTISKKERLAF